MSEMHRTIARSNWRRPRHSGVTIIVVLGIISITMALTYAVVRNQGVMMQIQLNSSSNSQARQAAVTGLTIALRKMHESTWAGVDTTLSASLNATDRYEVEYATGDPTLHLGDSDYCLYPYRVTLTSTGYSESVDGDASESSHTIKAVVQLVPRALASEPDTWPVMQTYTAVQWADEPVTMEVPVRIEGNVHAQGEWDPIDDYMYDSYNHKAFDGMIDEVAIYDKDLSATTLGLIYVYSVVSGLLPSAYASQSPVTWWRLNESAGATVATDSAGSNDGSYEGAVAGGAGPSVGGTNYAATFDGFNDHINLGRFDVSGNELTIAAWIKADDFDIGDARIISKATNADTDDHYWMLSTISSGGRNRLRFRLKAGGSTSTLIASSGNLYAGIWYFVSATYDGTWMKLYINGTLVGQQYKTGTLDTNPNVFAFLGNNPPGSPRARYLRDLQAMNAASEGDYRPLTGTIDTPYSRTSEDVRSLFTDDLQLTVNDYAALNVTPVTHPGTVSTYKLYPGGKSYQVESLGSSLAATTKVPDTLTNPLGLFRRDGKLTLYDNVSIQGTVITNSNGSNPDLEIYGTGVSMQPVSLLPLEGTSDPIQLPVVMVADDFRLRDGANVNLDGQVVVWDKFSYDKGYTNTALDVQGRVFAKEFELQGRYEWDQSDSWYRSRLSEFLTQLADGGDSFETRFPNWLKTNHSLDPEPTLKIQASSTSVTYHWPDFTSSIYVAHPDDSGLRWDLIHWIDGE